MEETYVIDTPQGINFFQLCARKAALKLEIKGLHRSGNSRTAYSICKSEYGLKGSRKSVLAQLEQMVADQLAFREQQNRDGLLA